VNMKMLREPVTLAERPSLAIIEHLFVYGTLAPGEPYHYIVAGIGDSWRPAVMRGQLLDEGWAARFGYSGLVVDDGGADISGVLVASTRLHQHWQRLDKFEEAGYTRQLAQAILPDRSRIQANVYVLRRRFR